MTDPKSKNASPEQARANAVAIRKLWLAGQESLRRLERLPRSEPNALTHGHREETFHEEADRLKTNIDKAAKMRRIGKEYTSEQIDSICQLVERHLSRFGETNLTVLLRVEDRTKRDQIMRQAIKQNWSTTNLERAVQAVRPRGRRRHVGRRPHLPDDPLQRMIALDALCDKWLRWVEEAGAELPKDVQSHLAPATGAMRTLKEAVEERIKRATSKRKQR